MDAADPVDGCRGPVDNASVDNASVDNANAVGPNTHGTRGGWLREEEGRSDFWPNLPAAAH
jgi:hypothetical protein